MNPELSSRHKAFLLMFLINTVAILTSVFFTSFDQALLVSVVAIILTFVTRSIWLPPNHGQTKVKLYSLYIVLLIAVSSTYGNWSLYLHGVLASIIPESSQLIFLLSYKATALSIPVLLLLSFTIYIVNRACTPTGSMGDNQSAFNKEIPEPHFAERLKNALVALEDDLKMINKQSNWTGSFYTDLDAEVYIKTKTKNKRKVSNLLKALNNKSGRAFLVLGEPGGGKSVALRKLAIELIPQVKEANKIPLYINLKEWNNTNWSARNPPNESQLLEFVRENVARRDLALSVFIDKYFDVLIEKKRFFFIFDSFDEIPQVMNVDDNSILIQQLSSVLYQFIKDNNNKPTGLVSSRHFRKPTSDFNASSEIEIRPFSGSQIYKSLKKMSNSPEELINEIFTKRTDLYLTAKNPFMASMLSKYIEIHGGLPKNRLDMFSVFIDDALNNSSRKLHELNMDKGYILDASKKIAASMFSDFGLEVSVNDLKSKFPNIKIDQLIECLKFARLIRASSSDEGRISFVHRRFCEYFVVLDLLNKESDIPFHEIPKDTQWRDALVLYCEVSDVEKAMDIANNCWSIIKADDGKGSIEAIHCIRFLRDAFKSRHDCIKHLQEDIQKFIDTELRSSKPVHWNKFVIELLCLCKVDVVEESVIRTLNMKDFWLCSTAIESCRHLPTVSKDLKVELGSYLASSHDLQFCRDLKNNLFNFGISDAFYSVKKYLILRSIEIGLFSLLYIILLCLEPTLTILCTFIFLLQILIIYFFHNIINTSKNKNKNNQDKPVAERAVVKYVNSFTSNGFLAVLLFSLKGSKRAFAFAPIIVCVAAVLIYILNEQGAIFDKTFNFEINVFYIYYILIIYFSCLYSSLILMFSTGAKKIDFSFLAIISVIILLSITFVFYAKEYIELFRDYFKYLFIGGLFILILLFFRKAKEHLIATKNYKKIIINKLTTRKLIHDAIISLDGYEPYINKLIDQIELNISSIQGDWPDNKILCSDSGAYASKLCQLDVRWLGID